jgi:malate permease and related proteins
MFFESIESILIIVIIMAFGYFLQKKGWFDDNFPKTISKLTIEFALPLDLFYSVQKYLKDVPLLSISSALVYPCIAVGMMYFLALFLVKLLSIRSGRKGIMINTFANANTVSVGLPLNIALFGEKSLPFFFVYYITNTLSTWTVGYLFIQNDASVASKEKEQKKKLNIKKLLPRPLIALIISFIFLILKIPVPEFVSSSLRYVGNLVVPLSLIYMGIMLYKSKLSSIRLDRDTIWALCGRFVFAPAGMILVLYVAAHLGSHLDSTLEKTLIVQSAAPALTVLPILAGDAKGDQQFAVNVVAISSVLFILVVPILLFLLPHIL